MLKSPLFRFLIWKHGLSADYPLRSNRKYVDDLLTELRRSKYVEKAILLAMDGVYDADGRLDLGKTDFLIANDYALSVARSYPDSFWPGVSINPQRRDAVEELERCVAAGAKLVKVLPNAQGFDPGDRRYRPFYRKLAQLHMPLLSHVGYEFSLIGKDQSAGDPSRLRVSLEEGVMVIAAHGCSNGLVFSEPYYQTFLELVGRYTNFFSDVSALTLPNRFGMLLRLRRHPELHDRLLFGTDYPLSVFHPPTSTFRADNRFDRQHLVLKWLGIGFRSFDQLPASP
jgi:predicted TIM-barrel fold metal-dependent hydrolase